LALDWAPASAGAATSVSDDASLFGRSAGHLLDLGRIDPLDRRQRGNQREPQHITKDFRISVITGEEFTLEMKALATEHARQHTPELISRFFQQPAEPFVPVYELPPTKA